jgi:hypothetical protein
LYESCEIFTSTRWEKAASRSCVRTWAKAGDSMRSEVSSIRRRREAVVVGDVDSDDEVMPDS